MSLAKLAKPAKNAINNNKNKALRSLSRNCGEKILKFRYNRIFLVSLFCLLTKISFTQITFDYSGAELVIEYFFNDKSENIIKIINHPGYLHVFEHSKKYSSSPLNKKLLESSLLGQSNAIH